MKAIILILVIVTFLIVDIAWIMANHYEYSKLVEAIQHQPLTVNKTAALFAYTLMVIGYLIIVLPLLETRRESLEDASFVLLMMYAVRYGGAFGFVAYGIFNATNAAMFQNYNIKTAFKDTLWGACVYSLLAFATLLLMKAKLL